MVNVINCGYCLNNNIEYRKKKIKEMKGFFYNKFFLNFVNYLVVRL